MNESIYYNVDKLHTAIAENRQIEFRYFEWTVSKEIRLKKGGENYQVSPWAVSYTHLDVYKRQPMLDPTVIHITKGSPSEFARSFKYLSPSIISVSW